MFVRESVNIGGRLLTFETGRLAKLAHGAVLVTFGESVVLVTCVSSEERPGLDFFPLTVNTSKRRTPRAKSREAFSSVRGVFVTTKC